MEHVVKDHIFVGLLSCEKTTKTYYFTFVREYLTNVLPYSPPLIILKMKFLDKINKLLLTISKDAWEEIRLAIQGTFQLWKLPLNIEMNNAVLFLILNLIFTNLSTYGQDIKLYKITSL